VEIRDPGAMRALAHPLRFAVLDLLMREGPATATRCAEVLDESPANMSFHLRTLAKHGFIVEAEGGKGREKPWRIADYEQRVRVGDDVESRAAAYQFREFFLENETNRLRQWGRRSHDDDPAWRDALGLSGGTLFVTLDELTELNDSITEVLMRFADRRSDPSARPAGSRVVRMFVGLSTEGTPP
jgi:DNA-binding transcriptional ArsR family regulator